MCTNWYMFFRILSISFSSTFPSEGYTHLWLRRDLNRHSYGLKFFSSSCRYYSQNCRLKLVDGSGLLFYFICTSLFNVTQLETFPKEKSWPVTVDLQVLPLFTSLRRSPTALEDCRPWNSLWEVSCHSHFPSTWTWPLALEPVALGQDGSTVLLSGFPLCPQVSPTWLVSRSSHYF